MSRRIVLAVVVAAWNGSMAYGQDAGTQAPEVAPSTMEGNAPADHGEDVTESIGGSEGVTEGIGGSEDVTESIGGSSSDGDTVETLGASDTTDSLLVGGSAPSSSSNAAQSETNRASVSGWARESLEFYPDDTRGGSPSSGLSIPRDLWLTRTQLLLRASYQRGNWFEAKASGAVGFTAFFPRTHQDGSERGTDEVLDARLMEAYLGFFGKSLDLRIGQQRVAWGVADALSPNDIVNARDLRDPFLSEPELNHIPTPMVRLSGYWQSFVLEALASPVFVPDRVTLYGRNWAAVQPDAPESYRGLLGMLRENAGPSLQEPVNNVLYQTRLPNRNGRGASFGAKLGIRSDLLDANLYYHNGYDGTPYVWIDPGLINVLEHTDFSSTTVSDLAPLLKSFETAPIFSEYVRRHHVGVDAMSTVGSFVLRVDAAYQTRRVFYRSDLTSIASPALLAVGSVEYQTGSVDKVAIVEAVFIRVMDEVDGKLLSYERNSYGFAGVVRWPIASVFHFEARGTLGLAPRYFTIQPALLAKFGSFVVKAGALVLNGEQYSLGWYNRHNTTAFMQVRYGF